MNIRKIVLIVCLSSLLPGSSEVYADSMPSVFLKFGDQTYQGESKPYVSDKGRTMVPLRAILEEWKIPFELITWGPDIQTATITRERQVIQITIGDPYIKVNGFIMRMDSAAKLIDGTTYVPIRFISQLFGAGVEWDGPNQVVTIKNGLPSNNFGDFGLSEVSGFKGQSFEDKNSSTKLSIRRVQMMRYDSPEASKIMQQLDLRVPGAPKYLVHINIGVQNTGKERSIFHWAVKDMLQLVINEKRLMPLASNNEDINRAVNSPELLFWDLGENEMTAGNLYYAVDGEGLRTIYAEMYGVRKQLAVAIK